METPQTAMFIESIYDALGEAVRQLGGAKAVGPLLWPHKSAHDARALLLNCLNCDRPEKFDPEQIVFILRRAREAGYHGAKHWFDDATGYDASHPSDPKVQQDRAVDAVAEASVQLARALTVLERLKPTLRVAS